MKLFYTFLVLLIACFSYSFAQERKNEELEVLKKKIRQSTYYDSVAVFKNGAKAISLARKMNSLSEEGLIYQYYGNFYFFSRNYPKADSYYKKTLEIAKRGKDKKLENSTEIRLAFLLQATDVLSAEKRFNTLLVEAKKYGFTENIIEAYNGLGIIFEGRLIHDESMKYYLSALKVAEKNKLKYHQAIILNNIGLIKLENKQREEAKKDFEKALKLAVSAEESRLAINLHSNLGLVNQTLRNFPESIKHYTETLQNARRLGFPTATAVAYINLASSLHENNESAKALTYTDSAIMLFSRFQEYEFLGKSYLLRGMIEIKLGNLTAAYTAVDSVLSIHKRNPSSFNYTATFDVLSNIYEKEGNYKKALEYTQKFHSMNDSLSEISNSDKLAELQVVYGKERVEAENENLKSRNSLLQKENELKRTRFRMTLIISIFVIVFAVGFVYVRSVRIRRKEQILFTQKLIENIDEERGRISKDLHDDIGQSLSVIKSKINMFNTGRIHSVDGLEGELGEVINQTRKISHHLHPSSLEKIGLNRSLAALLERTQESTNIVCSLDLFAEIELLPLDTKTQIFRIVQECINNTIKHANATALKVSVLKQDNGFELMYQDNGTGIKEHGDLNDGIGMMTIKERGNKLNGKTHFYTGNGGFKLSLKF